MKTRLPLALLLIFTGVAFANNVGDAAARSPRRQKQAAETAAAKPQLEKPKVTEIKEAGLKSLLEESAGRSRPLLVNFWATWCGPCREEFPDLVKVRERFAEDALDFVTVSLDDPSDLATTVPDFLAEMRAGRMPAYLLNAEDANAAISLVDATWQGELPATFLYDRAGALVFKHKGRVRPADLVAAIEKTRGAK